MPRQSHGDGPSRDLRDQVIGNRGGVGKRFVEGLNDARQQIDCVGLEDLFMMVRAKPLRDQTRKRQLIIGLVRTSIPDCEGPDPAVGDRPH